MSLGALSPEAHKTLNIAMNRIGAKSDSGEGGEDPAHFTPEPNGDNASALPLLENDLSPQVCPWARYRQRHIKRLTSP